MLAKALLTFSLLGFSITSPDAPNLTVKSVNVTDFGANGFDQLDDTKAIQDALNIADKSTTLTVYIPDGVYTISESLQIDSNTTLILDDLAVIIRNGFFSPMIINKTQGAKEYAANKNITIEGGTWEGNYDSFPKTFSIMLFGHMENLTIQNTRFLHEYNSHSLEINAVKNASILHNTFNGYKGPKKKEALQLDLAKSKGVFPSFGEYDQTPSKNILIQGNTFINQSRGIGSHSYTSGVFHDNVIIKDNLFQNISDKGINILNYNHVQIVNNHFKNVKVGIEIVSENPQETFHLNLKQNHFSEVETPITMKITERFEKGND